MAAAHASPPSGTTYAYLLRSEDRTSWEQLIGRDRCEPDSRPNATVSAPVSIGNGWLVSYVCRGLLESDFEFAEIHLVPEDGQQVEPIADMRTEEVRYYQPVVVGDTVVVPAGDLEGNVTLFHAR